MIKYIVTWVIVQTFSVPCPDINSENEFGITSNLMISCAALHLDSRSVKKEKYFFNKDSAYSFYKRAKEQNEVDTFSMEDRLYEVKIDSIFVYNKSKL